ncbi:ABC transporter ATP-binding protein [Candidatus Pantoea multigeneris]|uniref:ABC transporter ATP-binding protein n=1 Tax=Candidatus Pantoea multigeneris TaxID=2608357 RepID=A0ABX0R7D8_9GAMM|nr:ABC transporter ATP-binding protein [Pantoea multigeneris]NIF21286.1 ABC transporter ATP-binding protein [Pantoea multigeneris]
MAGMTLTALHKSFAAQPVLQDISLQINAGEFIAILGPSGCGKTTLLRLIAGFETLDSGEIHVGERQFAGHKHHLPPEARNLGVVFQSYALWPHMTVAENVAYSLKVSGVARAERETRTQQALALVGLEPFAQRQPADLSGGQRQRVALARCLVAKPTLVLLDEPLANLDVHLRATMEEEFRRFHQHSHATLIYITHDQQEAMALADRIVVLDAGRVMQFATPQILWREPANAMVARFIDDGRILPVSEIEPQHNGRAFVTLCGLRTSLRCSPQQEVQPEAQASFHAVDFAVAAPGEPQFAALVQRVIYRGSGYQINVTPLAHPDVSLTLMLNDTVLPVAGTTLGVAVRDGWILPC